MVQMTEELTRNFKNKNPYLFQISRRHIDSPARFFPTPGLDEFPHFSPQNPPEGWASAPKIL